MKALTLIALALLSGCSWFHARKPAAPEPPELIVTGAPAGSTVFIDDAQVGQPAAVNDRPQELIVAAGAHKVEVRTGATVVYREDTYVGPGEKHLVTVLSGFERQ